jgi:serine/threonine protein kinase
MDREFLKQTTRIHIPEIDEIEIHKTKYKMVKLIGKGQYGVVFLAVDTTHNQMVAIKMIEVYDPRKIETEIECLKKLQTFCKEYILCYIDSALMGLSEDFDGEIIDTDYFVIVTKFLENYISWTLFKKKYSKDKQMVQEKIKEALKFIHQQKISHGDIHGDNILVHPETLDVRFIDFGQCTLKPESFRYKQDEEDMGLLFEK